MKYYPLSQIETGFTSKKGDFKLLSPNISNPNIEKKIIDGLYVGEYFKTSDGKFFTGKTPTDSNGVLELQPLKESIVSEYTEDNINNISGVFSKRKSDDLIMDIIDQNSNQSFYTHESNFRFLTKKEFLSKAPAPPKFMKFKPVEADYIAGVVDRYFSKHITNDTIMEISKDTYNQIKNKNGDIQHELYKIMNIKWLLVDSKMSSEEFNSNQILIANNLGFRGLREYIQL